MSIDTQQSVERRARITRGCSDGAIYEMVAAAICRLHRGGGTLIDVGCGQGALRNYVQDRFDHYIGIDVVRYSEFPRDCMLYLADLEDVRWACGLPAAEVVVAIETIEHLENPRAFLRQLRQLLKPGGVLIVTTPNQLSLLSKATLLFKNQFNAFQERPGLYPAHLTALLETDLVRIAGESQLCDVEICYSDSGRVPGTSFHWPARLGLRGRGFSDNVMLVARTSRVHGSGS